MGTFGKEQCITRVLFTAATMVRTVARGCIWPFARICHATNKMQLNLDATKP